MTFRRSLALFSGSKFSRKSRLSWLRREAATDRRRVMGAAGRIFFGRGGGGNVGMGVVDLRAVFLNKLPPVKTSLKLKKKLVSLKSHKK